MQNNYTNLVFEGGGVKGIAYAGALEVLSEQNILPGIQKVAGTSAGAITATLIALDYTAAEIKETIMQLDFSTFKDGWDPLRFVTKYGLYEGDAFLNWLQTMIAQKVTAGANATFADFHQQGLRDLYVYATDLNIFDIKQFSYVDTPDVIVAEAVRSSMSIPLFFKAWKFTNNIPDDHIYVDGGVVLNYPLTVFDTITIPDDPQTLGFYLYDYNNAKKPGTLGYDDLPEYGKSLFETILSGQEIDFSVNPSIENRTVKIDDFGISATDFDITDAQKLELYNSGMKYTLAYLSKSAIPSVK